MMEARGTAVMYGAGNIGRGFIGQVFHDSGFEVVFIDVDPDVIGALNKRKSYTQLIIDGDITERREITNVRAVDGHDREAVVREIAGCEVMAVSVGAAVLPFIAANIAGGLMARGNPLNILVCENLIHAPDFLCDHVSKNISDGSVLSRTGFIGASIGRMVPVMPKERRAKDPSVIAVERFCTLPHDRDAIIDPMPDLKHVLLCSPFAFEEGKKLYIHNMGHALAAYFGYISGYTYIWQAVADAGIGSQVRGAMNAAADALARKYNEDRAGLEFYVDDLLKRFGNKGLGDTVARVGGDPMRKLAPGDRLAGAIDLCKGQGIGHTPILSGVAAALRFDIPGDTSSGLLQERLGENGIMDFLMNYCKLSEDDSIQCVDMWKL